MIIALVGRVPGIYHRFASMYPSSIHPSTSSSTRLHIHVSSKKYGIRCYLSTFDILRYQICRKFYVMGRHINSFSITCLWGCQIVDNRPDSRHILSGFPTLLKIQYQPYMPINMRRTKSHKRLRRQTNKKKIVKSDYITIQRGNSRI